MLKNNKLAFAIACLTAAGSGGTSLSTSAQELVLEEVIVTARMRAESLQSTPLSITALSGDLIDNRNITDVRKLMDQTPGVYFTNQGGPGLGNISMRGVSQGSLIGDESNVASFVDGFYWSGRIAFDAFLDGLERVEVVRGPQSALYGRNSFSGAINYITKKPDIEEMHWGFKGTYGEDGQREIGGHFSGPLIDGVLGLRVDASKLETGSTIKNPVNNERLNDSDSDNVRVQLAWIPTENFSVDYAYTYVDRETTDQPLYAVPQDELDGGYRNDFIAFTYRNTKIENPEPRPSSDLDRHVSALIGSTYEVDRHTVRFDYDSDKVLTSLLMAFTDEEITSIQDATYGAGGNIIIANLFNVFLPPGPGNPAFVPVDLNEDFIPDLFPVIGGQPNEDREDFSVELRFQSQTEGKLSWEVGAFYSHLEYTSQLLTGYDVSDDVLDAALDWNPVGFPTVNAGIIPATYSCSPMDPSTCGGEIPMVVDVWGVTPSVQVLQEKFYENTDYSVFASLGYELTDKTNIQIELRQTWEERTLDDRIEVTQLYDNPFPEKIEEDYSVFTPRFILDHQLTDNTFLYAIVGKGAKAGGAQPSQSADSTLYDPEENWTYEIGSKFILLDGRMNLNFAAFYIDWTDLQLRENIGLDNVVTNLGEAEVKGIEILGAYKVHENVQMRFGYTYQDGEIKEGSTSSAAGFCDLPKLEHELVPIGFGNPAAFDPVIQEACGFVPDPSFETAGSVNLTTGNIEGNRLSNAPESTFVYGVDVNVPLNNDWALFATADVNYRSQTYLDFENYTSIDGTTLVNGQIGATWGDWRFTLWGDNLTDEDTVVASIRNFNILGQTAASVQHRNGRTYGVTIAANF